MFLEKATRCSRQFKVPELGRETRWAHPRIGIAPDSDRERCTPCASVPDWRIVGEQDIDESF
jgi:hypothetical protein